MQNDKPSPGRGDQKIARVKRSGTLGKTQKMKMSPVRGGIWFLIRVATNDRKLSDIRLKPDSI